MFPLTKLIGAFLTFPGFIVTFFLIAALLAALRRKKEGRFYLLIALTMYLFSSSWFSYYLSRVLSVPDTADRGAYIVVLGGGVDHYGAITEIGKQTLRRLYKGFELYQRQHRKIVVTGGVVSKGIPEGDLMKRCSSPGEYRSATSLWKTGPAILTRMPGLYVTWWAMCPSQLSRVPSICGAPSGSLSATFPESITSRLMRRWVFNRCTSIISRAEGPSMPGAKSHMNWPGLWPIPSLLLPFIRENNSPNKTPTPSLTLIGTAHSVWNVQEGMGRR